MDKAEVIIKLKKYKTLLAKEMAFEKMILFGSYAKDTQREDSDVDVVIIVDKIQGDYFSTRPLLWRIRREVDDRIEPVILENTNDQSGFLQEIKKNGILI
jgi:predicted nucleotidyltransferase